MDRDVERAIECDCGQTLLRFYDAFDAWDYEGMAALFTPDGVWHRAGKALRGRQAIIAEMHRRPTSQVIRHVVTNLIVDAQDAVHANARLYLTVYRHDAGERRVVPAPLQGPALVLVVTAKLQRLSEGWRIAEQTMNREFEQK
ncbi:nuclear transport factor 2 family protein [Variovorax sp. Sphag1AA]|uniref:nuclear transport factor 2 family protein n=1 Tax=Variovorax sp. Sphag1AA TaxID=2587027 RepID=UPI00161E39BA|nr:nuclear transport factor 2 family protein [Variovorax sp. Sphag1AA]MBB3180832.1 uncharacterized protein (TIGR02246 family) [Variovorax sp. Sphag1AA]